jgi:hypothetical protein
MTELVLTGLDGKNPLAFLAALGVLNATTLAVKQSAPAPKLVWRSKGTFAPAIVDGPEHDVLLDVLTRDLVRFKSEPAIELRYSKAGAGAQAHDLKPPPSVFVEYLRSLRHKGARLSLDFAAAFATDVATDNGGNTKPTALHFTAGQQEFLAMVTELRDQVGREDLEEAVFGPWKYSRPLPVLQWDNTTARDYAVRASDPSKEKKLGVPGADWLAFRGLTFFHVAPVGARILTTACSGGWKTGVFRWPLWSVPLTPSVIAAALASPEIGEADPRVLEARGISIVFESSIRRSDQGGYGSFTPARVAARRSTPAQ